MDVMCSATLRASSVPTVVDASSGVNTMWLRGDSTCAGAQAHGAQAAILLLLVLLLPSVRRSAGRGSRCASQSCVDE